MDAKQKTKRDKEIRMLKIDDAMRYLSEATNTTMDALRKDILTLAKEFNLMHLLEFKRAGKEGREL